MYSQIWSMNTNSTRPTRLKSKYSCHILCLFWPTDLRLSLVYFLFNLVNGRRWSFKIIDDHTMIITDWCNIVRINFYNILTLKNHFYYIKVYFGSFFCIQNIESLFSIVHKANVNKVYNENDVGYPQKGYNIRTHST